MQDSSSLFFADKKLFENKEFVLKLVQINGIMLKYANEKLKNDKYIVL